MSEVRRSSRPNKGQHRFARWTWDEPEPEPKSRPRSGAKRQKTAAQPAQATQATSEGIVMCLCGARDSDPDDPRIMAECEKCLRWQHIECLFGVNDESVLPEPYLCHECNPSAYTDARLACAMKQAEIVPFQAPAPDSALDSRAQSSEAGNSPPRADAEPEVQAETRDAAAAAHVDERKPHIGDLNDKVRRSVCEALDKIFLNGLVDAAIAAKELPADTNKEEYAEQLSLEIEAALYEHHASRPSGGSKKEKADVGQRYRDRFRTLSFNLRDNKNPSLQMRIVTRQLSPDACATLSSEEMLNPELQRLADEVRKESIRESVLRVDDVPRVRRTHKGEEVIENVDGAELVSADGGPGGGAGGDSERTPDSSTASVAADGEPPAAPVTYDQPDGFDVSFSPSYESPRDDSDGEQMPHVSLSDESDGGDEGEGDGNGVSSGGAVQPVAIWSGELVMPHVAELKAKAIYLGSPDLRPELWSAAFDPRTNLHVSGRLGAAKAAAYLQQTSKSRLIASFLLVPDEASDARSAAAYEALYKYFVLRERVGVLAERTEIVKDAYLVPLAPDELIPTYLSLDDGALAQLHDVHKDRPVLLGVYVLPALSALHK